MLSPVAPDDWVGFAQLCMSDDSYLHTIEGEVATAWAPRLAPIRSPVSPVIRLNLGDAFLVLAEHAKRHLQQVTRIISMPEFAAA